MSQNCLIVFAKYPEPGTVKTRLAAAVGDEKACEIYTSIVQRILAQCKSDSYDLVVAVHPAHKASDFSTDFGVETVGQVDGDLGAKMLSAFGDCLKKYAKAIIIGSDIPTIDAKKIAHAFAELEKNDLVMGKATDGGYYLIGMKQSIDVFSGIQWSTPVVFEQTMENITAQNLSVSLLDPIPEIDTIDDWNSFNAQSSRLR